MLAATLHRRSSPRDPERSLAEVDFVALDTETTGLWWGDRLIELGAVRFTGTQVTDRFRSFVRPHRGIPEEVTRIHGITDARVAEAPEARSVLSRFNDFTQGAVLLAHNAVFDQGILATAYVRAGLLPPEARLYCTLTLARKVIPESPRHGLSSLAKHLSLPVTSAHRALPDADTARRIFLSCLSRLGADSVLGSLNSLAGEDGKGYSLRHVVCRIDTLPQRLRPLCAALRQQTSVELSLSSPSGHSFRAIPTALYARGPEAWVDLCDPWDTERRETSIPLARVLRVRA